MDRLVGQLLDLGYAAKTVREHLREWVGFARTYEDQDAVLPSEVHFREVAKYSTADVRGAETETFKYAGCYGSSWKRLRRAIDVQLPNFFKPGTDVSLTRVRDV
jgi:hypothetical protein